VGVPKEQQIAIGEYMAGSIPVIMTEMS